MEFLSTVEKNAAFSRISTANANLAGQGFTHTLNVKRRKVYMYYISFHPLCVVLHTKLNDFCNPIHDMPFPENVWIVS